MIQLDLTALPKPEKTIRQCTVTTIPAGSVPKTITVTLPGADGEQMHVIYQGQTAIAVNDVVSIRVPPDSNVAYLDGETHSGSSAPSAGSASLFIDGDTDEIQLRVQGHSTQTANIFEIEQSDTTNVLVVDNNGAIIAAGELSFTGTDHAGVKLLSLTTVQRDALTAANGMVIYNTTDNKIQARENGSWVDLSDVGSGASPWTTDSGVVNLNTDGNSVTVGSNTLLGKLAIDGDADEIQLVIQGHSTQTSNIITAEQSDGTDVWVLDNSGNVIASGELSFSGTGHAGIKLNSLTTTQRDALTAANGMLLYNSTDGKAQVRQNGAWADWGSGGGSASLLNIALSAGGVVAVWFFGNGSTSPNIIDLTGQGRNLEAQSSPTIGHDTAVNFGYGVLSGTGSSAKWRRTDEGAISIVGTESRIESAIRGLTLWAIVEFDNSATADEFILGQWSGTAGNYAYKIHRKSDGQFEASISDDGTNILSATSTGSQPGSGEPIFVGMRWVPSTSLTLYVNGNAYSNTTSIYATLNNSASSFTVGKNAGDNDDAEGKIFAGALYASRTDATLMSDLNSAKPS